MVKTQFGLKSTKHKGFTLTEMVIVIAVIAVLAAVLIPTFVGIASKAKVSADVQVANQATTLAGGADSLQEIYNNISSEVNVDIFTTKSGGSFAYEENHKTFVLLDSGYNIVSNDEIANSTGNKLWFFVKNSDKVVKASDIKDKDYKIGYFLCNDFNGSFSFDSIVDFETGDSTLNGGISYGSASQSISDTATLNLNAKVNGTILINAPNADVNQEGSASTVDAVAVKMGTLTINGRVESVKITSGKVKVSSNAYVQEISVPTTAKANSVAIENKGYVTKIATENVSAVKEVKTEGGIIANIPTEIKNVTEGEQATEIQINNYSQLCSFRDEVNAGTTFEGLTIKLTSNITLQSGWTPIGAFKRSEYNATESGKKSFSGTFDGGNYTISGLSYSGFNVSEHTSMLNKNDTTITGMNEFAYGLFGVVTNATIKNLTIDNPNIQINFESGKYGDSVGALIGFGSGKIVVDNVKVTNGTVSAYDCVAGLIGRIYNANEVKIENCEVSATVTGCTKVAGIVAYIKNTENTATALIENCKVTGNVNCVKTTVEKLGESEEDVACYAGGILSFADHQNITTTINDCEVTGTVSAENKSGNEKVNVRQGNIVGYITKGNVIGTSV